MQYFCPAQKKLNFERIEIQVLENTFWFSQVYGCAQVLDEPCRSTSNKSMLKRFVLEFSQLNLWNKDIKESIYQKLDVSRKGVRFTPNKVFATCTFFTNDSQYWWTKQPKNCNKKCQFSCYEYDAWNIKLLNNNYNAICFAMAFKPVILTLTQNRHLFYSDYLSPFP